MSTHRENNEAGYQNSYQFYNKKLSKLLILVLLLTIHAEDSLVLSGNIFAGYSLTYFLDLSADFPLYWDKTGWKQDRAGTGDLEIAAKLQYPWQKREAAVSHAFFLKAVLPTGSDNRGFFARHAYYLEKDILSPDTNFFTTNHVYWNPQLLWAVLRPHQRTTAP